MYAILLHVSEPRRCTSIEATRRDRQPKHKAMTINYNLAVSTSKPWTLFKLLLKWRGSIWKAVIVELTVWLLMYGLISVIYRCALDPVQQRSFEKVVQYLDKRVDYIPLNFMLGFFVTVIVNRWTYLYQIIGFIDNIGLMAAEYVRGRTELARMYRRNILRYCELAQVLVFRDISMRTRRRFPTLDTVVAAGFMMEHEKARFDEIQYRYSKYWMPFQWALALTYDARKKGLIESDYYQVVVSEEIKKFRTGLAWICNYDWVPIPIMYPQLVCLAVHTYFLVCLLSRQYIVTEHAANKTEIDLYFPIMSALQFIFYMGWMKVAEAMLNPFGEDDDDFECNALIDRNITMGLMIVDQGYDNPPDIRRDPFFGEEVEPLYSEETAKIPTHQMRGSVSHVKLPEHITEVKMVPHAVDKDNLTRDHTSPDLRRRVSVVPVKRGERRASRASVGSIEMFRNMKQKFERSMSRTRLEAAGELPRKTRSTSNLESMEAGRAPRPILASQQSMPTPTDENLPNFAQSFGGFATGAFSNKAFQDSEEQLASPAARPGKSPSDPQLQARERNASSGAGKTLAHDFPHHVLDNVLEDDEEEDSIVRKKSLSVRASQGEESPASTKSVKKASLSVGVSSTTPYVRQVDSHSDDDARSYSTETTDETCSEAPVPTTEQPLQQTRNRSSDFFIGHEDEH